MNILAFNSTSDISSISLYMDGVVIEKKTIEKKRENSAKLVPLIQEILSDYDLSIDSLDVIISSKGPGSFTGIRIGLSILVGFTVAGIGAKIYAPSSFDILNSKYHAKDKEKILVSIDSGRGDYFVCCYDDNNNIVQEPLNISDDELLEIKKLLNVDDVYSGFDSDDMIKWFLKASEDDLSKAEIIEPFYIRPPDVTIKNKGPI